MHKQLEIEYDETAAINPLIEVFAKFFYQIIYYSPLKMRKEDIQAAFTLAINEFDWSDTRR